MALVIIRRIRSKDYLIFLDSLFSLQAIDTALKYKSLGIGQSRGLDNLSFHCLVFVHMSRYCHAGIITSGSHDSQHLIHACKAGHVPENLRLSQRNADVAEHEFGSLVTLLLITITPVSDKNRRKNRKHKELDHKP